MYTEEKRLMARKNEKCTSSHPTLLKAAKSHYEAQRDEALAVLDVYSDNSVGVADHSNLLDEVKKWLCKLSEAEECLDVLSKHYLDS
jgi:hypothetical protein